VAARGVREDLCRVRIHLASPQIGSAAAIPVDLRAQRRVGGTMIDRAELRNEIQSIEAQNQPVETFRHCPKCGADHFTQRPLRSTEPSL
jgi:hypothetical protein